MKHRLLCTLLLFALAVGQTWAQTITVSGTVTSADDGSALPGVSVIQKGTTNGTTTDGAGRYSISIPGNATLVFSFLGLENQEIAVNNRTSINVALKSGGAQQLEEVVVTGLGSSIKRSNLANAVATVSAEELVGKTRPQTVDAALQGKVVGANITQNGGAPGGGVSIQLRGISTLAGASQPLIIVDGVYVNNEQLGSGAGSSAFTAAGSASILTGRTSQDQTTNRLSDINPADIETVEVLKGSSAAAIYGSRANAGVIIITTKKGRLGRTSVNLSQDFGITRAQKLMGTSNWTEEKINSVFSNPTKRAEEIALWKAATAAGKIYDYEKELFGNTGTISNTRLSVSGGSEKTKFFLAASRNDETGILDNTGFERTSIRANIDQKLSKFLDFSLTSNYIRANNQRGFFGNDNNGIAITYNLAYIPNYWELHPNEGGAFPDSRKSENPLAVVARAKNREETNRFLQSGAINFNLLNTETQQLKVTFSGGIDYLNTANHLYLPEDLQSQRSKANPGAVRNGKSINFATNFQALALYNASAMGNRLNLTTQVGTARITNQQELSHIQGLGLPAKQTNPSQAKVQSSQTYFQSYQDVGIFAQQEANFEDKIVGTVGIRFDKSSLLGDHEKYYMFPKASVAVNLANFGFWGLEAVNQFKLRTAYGETGGMPNYGVLFSSLNNSLMGDQAGYIPSSIMGNEKIEPERAQELELGVDVGLFNDKVVLEATFYNKEVKDLIYAFITASSTGVTSIAAYPVGDLRNRGIELGLTVVPVENELFTWTSTTQYWHNRTEVTKVNVPAINLSPGFGGSFGTTFFTLGESPSRWWGTPGKPGTTTGLTRYEESQPDFQISFANNFTILRNFDLSFLLHWKQGGYISNLGTILRDEGGTSPDWSEDDDNNGVPNGEQRQGESARTYIQDGSYVRLREVSLYYTLPSQVRKTLFRGLVQNARVGVSANNLLTFTDYEGYDPEVSNFGNTALGAPVDLGSVPSTKRMFFHLSFDF